MSIARSYAVNGLNQYTSAGQAAFTYDANGNLSGDGLNTYTYDIENRLIGRSGGAEAALFYDPLGRLAATNGAPHLPGSGAITRFLYDPGSASGAGGDALVAEYDGAGSLARRYMHGPGVDEPILWDEGQAMNCSGTRFLHTNHQGSIIAVADCNGNRTSVNSYDEYGIPAGLISGSTPNSGRFGYTGQTWIPELGLWYYKARFMSPTLGRFMQTDPIGYDDGLNWYAYVGGDPVNRTDPDGKESGSVGFNSINQLGQARAADDDPERLRDERTALAIGAGLIPVVRIIVRVVQAVEGSTAAQNTTKAGDQAADKIVPRTTRSGDDAVRVTKPDGSVKDISAKRVKEFTPNTDPRAPPGTLQKVKFENEIEGSKGFKRAPTAEELKLLKGGK